MSHKKRPKKWVKKTSKKKVQTFQIIGETCIIKVGGKKGRERERVKNI